MLMKSFVENQFWSWRGYEIHFIKVGKTNDFPPLLLVHGFGSSTDQWMKNIIEFKNEFEVWAIDLLGFGRSTKADTEYSLSLWCDQLKDFISEVIGKPVVIIGNSIGGYMALFINSMSPEITCGAILLNPVGCFNEIVEPSAIYYKFFRGFIDKLSEFLWRKGITGSLVFRCVKKKYLFAKYFKSCI